MRSGRSPARRWPLVVLAVVVAVLATGCQVQTRVEVSARGNGTGQVAVVVTLDRAAAEAVPDLVGQLRTSDLVAAGWDVRTTHGATGATVIRASHGYATPAQASALVADLAGTGPAASRPFRLTVSTGHGWWRSTTEVRGLVDLRCGLACFGDPGLTRQLGRSTGVAPGPLSEQRRTFTFAVGITLPGQVSAPGAAARSGDQARWTPVLGRTTVLLATSSALSVTHVVVSVVVVGLLVLLLLPMVVIFLRRRRRSRRRTRNAHARRRGAGPPGPGGADQAVTPAP